MSQATRRATTLTTLDAIAPNRHRFAVINNPSPTPTESPTMAAINRAAMQLAAKGPLFPDLPIVEPLPGVTHYGYIYDQRAYTDAVLAARKGGAL